MTRQDEAAMAVNDRSDERMRQTLDDFRAPMTGGFRGANARELDYPPVLRAVAAILVRLGVRNPVMSNPGPDKPDDRLLLRFAAINRTRIRHVALVDGRIPPGRDVAAGVRAGRPPTGGASVQRKQSRRIHRGSGLAGAAHGRQPAGARARGPGFPSHPAGSQDRLVESGILWSGRGTRRTFGFERVRDDRCAAVAGDAAHDVDADADNRCGPKGSP